jgi:hypothetical protein
MLGKALSNIKEFIMNTKAIITSSILSLAVISAATHAATQRFNATVKVTNTFEFTKDKDLSFGTIRAKADTAADKVATLVMSADPDVVPDAPPEATGAAVISIMSGESHPASFSITGLPEYAVLTITDPTETDVRLPGSESSAAKFTLSNFNYFVTKGGTLGEVSGAKLKADVEGNIAFNLGATLTTSNNTDHGTTTDYTDGDYSGTFSLQVNY